MAFRFSIGVAFHAAFRSSADFIVFMLASVKKGAMLSGSSRAPARAEPFTAATSITLVKTIFLMYRTFPIGCVLPASGRLPYVRKKRRCYHTMVSAIPSDDFETRLVTTPWRSEYRDAGQTRASQA